ncbi:MAG: 50S ribosome-binding GTPase [Nanoarchaeota archaeon]|nr:50S ribosome-binding GTPase [Nanoarchaeota archaeon]MBU4352193.1 50S ribosome-binding GTPase [Nanoarchaeota archaeon]MBU4456437.1 50S ribosome-binding GTPase [Nanoarchaeota archaeon]MCG2719603.1 50S ribosome-binding GTPase [Nanoarchaeota archaeon]
MRSFWKIVNEVIKESDIILEILDSRFIEQTRNKEIEDKVRAENKQLIYVINKCDLVDKELLERKKKILKPSVFVSAMRHQGTSILLRTILQFVDKKKERVIIGVVGYPNTGKSSVINALKGRASASVSPIGGHTKGRQLVKITKQVYLMDTPGVYPYMEKDQTKHALISSVDFNKVKDPIGIVYKLYDAFREILEEHFKIKTEDAEDFLEKVASKLNLLKKGNQPDIDRAARAVLKDWQHGKLK